MLVVVTSDCQGAVGDPDDGANAVADARAEDGDGSGYPYVKAGRVASRPGYPAEPAARSRPFGRVSLAPPFADAHCALRLPGGSLRSPPCAGPTRSWPRSTAPPTSPPCPPRHGASRRARRGTRFARPGRPRRLRASPRLLAVALRASPVPDNARAPDSVPRRPVVPAQVRTLPPEPSAARCARLPSALSAVPATQAPWRLPSAGFAGVDSPIAQPLDLPFLTARGGFFLTPHAARCLCMPVALMTCPFGLFQRLSTPGCCWTERMLLSIHANPLFRLDSCEANAVWHSPGSG